MQHGMKTTKENTQKKSLDEQGIKNASWVKMQYPAKLNEGLAESIADFVKGLEA